MFFLLLEIRMVLDVVNFNLIFAHLGLVEFFLDTNSVVLVNFYLIMIQIEVANFLTSSRLDWSSLLS